jgi:hypothetical protein
VHCCSQPPALQTGQAADQTRTPATPSTRSCRYESTQDGFIDRDEFAAGLARLGLSISPASLALDEPQQGQLLEVLFRDTAGGPSSDRVSHDVFDANLAAAGALDFMADSYMLLDPWCYNSR